MISKLAISGRVYLGCAITWISNVVAWMPMATIHNWQEHTEWLIRVTAGVIGIVAGVITVLIGLRNLRNGDSKKGKGKHKAHTAKEPKEED